MQQAAKWLYRLDHGYSWQSPFRLLPRLGVPGRQGRTRLVLTTEGVIRVVAGYAWDGCTPKTCFLDVVIGTPDGVVYVGTGRPKTYYASLVHDALYQFLPDGLPLTRVQVDRCFLQLMTESQFAPRHLYYWAVRAFGWLTRPITRRVRAAYGARRSRSRSGEPRRNAGSLPASPGLGRRARGARLGARAGHGQLGARSRPASAVRPVGGGDGRDRARSGRGPRLRALVRAAERRPGLTRDWLARPGAGRSRRAHATAPLQRPVERAELRRPVAEPTRQSAHVERLGRPGDAVLRAGEPAWRDAPCVYGPLQLLWWAPAVDSARRPAAPWRSPI